MRAARRTRGDGEGWINLQSAAHRRGTGPRCPSAPPWASGSADAVPRWRWRRGRRRHVRSQTPTTPRSGSPTAPGPRRSTDWPSSGSGSPSGWVKRQDHAKHGIVADLPAGEDPVTGDHLADRGGDGPAYRRRAGPGVGRAGARAAELSRRRRRLQVPRFVACREPFRAGGRARSAWLTGQGGDRPGPVTSEKPSPLRSGGALVHDRKGPCPVRGAVASSGPHRPCGGATRSADGPMEPTPEMTKFHRRGPAEARRRHSSSSDATTQRGRR